VTKASVTVEGNVVGSIGKGMCVFIGIHQDDKEEDLKWLVKKLLNARLWDSDSKKWANSVQDMDYELLLVSQFTLYGRWKGNKMDYSKAMVPDKATVMFDEFVKNVREDYKEDRVATGEFGAYMDVDIANDGPITLIADSNNRKGL